MRTIIIIVLLFICFNESNSQWGNSPFIPFDSHYLNGSSDIAFVSDKSGWIVGENYQTGIIYHTKDGGSAWESQYSIQGASIKSIFMLSENVGWILVYLYGSGINVYSTSEGGQTWSKLTNFRFGNSRFVHDISFFDKNNGVMVGDSFSNGNYLPPIFRTSDGGKSWSETATSNHYFLNCVNIVSSSLIFAGGNQTGENSPQSCTIIKSADGGIIWKEVFISQNKDYMIGDYRNYRVIKIKMINELSGYSLLQNSVDRNSILIKTTNGGDTWEFKKAFPQNVLSDLFIYDKNTFYLCGKNSYNNKGVILKSTSNGEEWGYQNIPLTSYSVTRIEFININTGFALSYDTGGWSQLFKTTNSGGITDIENNKNTFVSNYSLSQNYPNPFNPSTTIKYSIPKTSLVQLKIYDMLGSEIKTLVNEEKVAGNYEVQFDGKNLSSGVYIYQLNASGYSESKRFVLVK